MTTQAISSYTTVRNNPGELTLTLAQQRIILNVLGYAIKHNDNITSWSTEVELFDLMSEAYKAQLEALAADIEYQQKYAVERQSGRDMLEAREKKDVA